jgi:uncharacterized repeat protein (TIGR03803 family)
MPLAFPKASLLAFLPIGAAIFIGFPSQGTRAQAVSTAHLETAVETGRPAALARGLTTLHRFLGQNGGDNPRGGLVMDARGHLYGTTEFDGDCSPCGVIYKLSPRAGGRGLWSFRVVHEFGKTLQDGIRPTGPLTIRNGVIYGTTSAGADPSCGCGSVFKVTPTNAAGTAWRYEVIHRFTRRLPRQPLNGSTPVGGVLIIGSTIYGATSAGGRKGAGVFYRMGLDGRGFRVLHHFAGNFNGGPQGELLLGRDRAIYGTTFGGGRHNQGTIFRITTAGAHSVLYDFRGVNQPGGSTDGANPRGRLVQARDGTIYGTTSFGGTPSGWGTAWSIKKVGTRWVYAQIHRFGGGDEANLPHSGFVRKSDTVLYGTGAGGGANDDGAVYELRKLANGTWRHKTLHSFRGRHPDGDIPFAVLLLHRGVIYGTNLVGGNLTRPSCSTAPGGCGTVFAFKP